MSEHDEELTLVAILLLLQQRDPEHAAEYALLAQQAATDARATVETFSGAVAEAIEAAATKAAEQLAAAHAAGDAATFGDLFAALLDDVLARLGLGGDNGGKATMLEQILTNIVLPNYNDGRYQNIFGGADGANAWEFVTKGDGKVCGPCKSLAGRRFLYSDVAARHLLPLIHWGDRCYARALYDYAGPVDDGADFLNLIDLDWDYDKAATIVRLRRAA